MEPGVPAVEAWSLNHWTTREVPRAAQFVLVCVCVCVCVRHRKRGGGGEAEKGQWSSGWAAVHTILENSIYKDPACVALHQPFSCSHLAPCEFDVPQGRGFPGCSDGHDSVSGLGCVMTAFRCGLCWSGPNSWIGHHLSQGCCHPATKVLSSLTVSSLHNAAGRILHGPQGWNAATGHHAQQPLNGRPGGFVPLPPLHQVP